MDRETRECVEVREWKRGQRDGGRLDVLHRNRVDGRKGRERERQG